MNALAGATAATAATLMLWTISARAAQRRTLNIGTVPVLLPASVAGAAIVACGSDVHASGLVALSGSAVAGWVDARTGYIFDPLTLTSSCIAFALAALEGHVLHAAAGAALLGATLLFLHAVTGGRGIGLGDVKLGATLGAALGMTCGLTAIGMAFVLGAAYGIWLLLRKRANGGTPVRFAPFIAAGTFAAVLLPPLVLR